MVEREVEMCISETEWKNCKVAVFVVQNEVIEEFQSKFEMSQSYKLQYKENFLILKIAKWPVKKTEIRKNLKINRLILSRLFS